MNKRGFFLAEETMKIILAVICIGFLLFVLGKMYYSYTVDKEIQQAKDTLARVEKEINSMKDGDKRDIVTYGPAPGTITGVANWWVLASFSGGGRPNFCSEKGWNNCLCLCKNSWFGSTKNKCDETDVCVSFSGKQLPVGYTRDLKSLPITIPVKQIGNVISFS